MISIEAFTAYVSFRHGKTVGPGVSGTLEIAKGLIDSLTGDDSDAVPGHLYEFCVYELGTQLFGNGGQPPDLAPFAEILAPTHGIGTVR